VILPVPSPDLWHLLYRRKALASGTLGEVLLALSKLPPDKRIKVSLRARRLRKDTP